MSALELPVDIGLKRVVLENWVRIEHGNRIPEPADVAQEHRRYDSYARWCTRASNRL